MTDDVLEPQAPPTEPHEAPEAMAEEPSITATLRFPVPSEAPEATTDDQPDEAKEATTGDQPHEAPEAMAEEPSITATLRFPVPTEAPEATTDDQPDEATEATTAIEAPHLRDVLRTLTSWARAIPRRCGRMVARHRRVAIVAALAAVGLVLAVALHAFQGAQTPPDSLVASDARERLAAPSMVASNYALDEPLVATDFDIQDKRASAARADACDVTLEARFANAAIEAVGTATLTYVRASADSWECTAASIDEVSYRATSGVSAEAATDHVDELLRAAGADEEEGEALVAAYRGAEVSLVGEHFNEELQTDALTLHCASGTAFMSRECDLTAHFRFVPASGAWELSEARVSDGAFDLGFQPLVGSWEGRFLSQQAKGGKCLAAREAGLTLDIEKASVNRDGVAVIEGTVSGLAHLHDPLEGDVEQHADDEALNALPFAGTLRTPSDADLETLSLWLGGTDDADANDIVFDCVTQDLAHGSVSLVLDFGTGEDADGATATLTSSHPYEESFALFWTYEAQTRYEDRFELTKVS